MRKGWIETTLGEIATLSMGRTPSRNEKNYWTDDLTYPFCTIADMDGKFIFPNREGVTNKAIQNGKAKIAPKGTLLMSFKLTIGRMGFAGQDIYPNEAIVSILPNSTKSLDMFLYYLLGFQDLTAGSGRAIKGETLNSKSLSAIPIYLPPPVEQKRIVDVVSSVDAYIDALQHQADTARVARNAVLHDLLSAGGDDWVETRIGEFVSVQSGFAFSAKDWSEDGYPVVKINNVRDGKVSLESCSFVSHPLPKGSEKFQLHRGDLLITLTGEIGATGTVSVEGPLFLNQRVGKVTVSDDSRAILCFVTYLLSSSKLRSEMWSLGKGNAQLNISPSSIHGLAVNLPPLAEQKRISEIMSSLDEVIHSTEQAVIDAKALRSGLLLDLLSGNHEIPASYDSLLGAA